MRAWTKRTLIGLIGAAALVVGLSGCGHYGHGSGRGQAMSAEDQAKMKDKIVQRVVSKLELDTAQKQKLDVLATKLLENRNALRGTNDPRVEIQGLVASEKFDRTKAQAMVNERTTVVQSKSPEIVAALGDFYDSLNPKQQTEVREFLQKRRGFR
jgi:periplasmic protein CpxP/Spy